MTVVFQPEFDSRNLTVGNASSALRRGQMWRDPATTGTASYQSKDSKAKGNPIDTTQWGFQFLYNPSTLQVGYNMDGTLYPTGVLPSDSASGNGDGSGTGAGTSDNNLNLIGPGSSTLTFDLILDRTYECWGDSRQPTEVTSKMRLGLDIDTRRGVMVDFEHFNAMMGYTEENPFVISQPLFLSFGNKRGNFYYGYITSYGFGVSNWTQYMIPNRGGISGIQFQILPLPKNVKNGTNEGGALTGYKLGKLQSFNAVTSNVLKTDEDALNPVGGVDPLAYFAAMAPPGTDTSLHGVTQ